MAWLPKPADRRKTHDNRNPWYNLTLGADFSAEKRQEAIDKSSLSDLAAQKGLDFVLAEEGENVSGGQKQRIEIARALLYDCSVLLVDKGTSAPDDKTALTPS